MRRCEYKRGGGRGASFKQAQPSPRLIHSTLMQAWATRFPNLRLPNSNTTTTLHTHNPRRSPQPPAWPRTIKHSSPPTLDTSLILPSIHARTIAHLNLPAPTRSAFISPSCSPPNTVHATPPTLARPTLPPPLTHTASPLPPTPHTARISPLPPPPRVSPSTSSNFA